MPPTKKLVLLFAAIALVSHEVSAELPGFNRANGLFPTDASSASRTSGADYGGKTRSLRTSDGTTSKAAEESRVAKMKPLKGKNLPAFEFHTKTLKAERKPKDRKATGEEIDRIIESLQHVKIHKDVHVFNMKPSRMQWPYSDKTPDEVSHLHGHDNTKLMENFNPQVESRLIAWSEKTIPPEDIPMKLKEAFQLEENEAQMYAEKYKLMYKKHLSEIQKYAGPGSP